MRKMIYNVFILALMVHRTFAKLDPHTDLDVYQIAALDGYPIEAYQVRTDDGYILTIQRIPHGLNNSKQSNKPPVLMVHGLMSSAVDFINAGKDKSLAYKLADLGYDVWMGNCRGTSDSRKHIKLNPDADRAAYWSFSWNEIGRYDVPAMIDYVLAQTNQKQLQYIGYSQGATTFYVMASSRPEYNAKIKLATTIAPPVLMAHTKSPPGRVLAPFTDVLMFVTQLLGIREFGPKHGLVHSSIQFLCRVRITQGLCKILFSTLSGYDWPQLNDSMLPVYTSNFPGGCNFKQFAHYFQLMNSGKFQNYDYHSRSKNMAAYGTPEAPLYDLSHITVPLSIFYAENDWFVSDVDAKELVTKLSNVVNSKLVSNKLFSHLDFLWAKNVVPLVFDDVIQVIERYR